MQEEIFPLRYNMDSTRVEIGAFVLSPPPNIMPLPSLPHDVLLAIFRDLDIVDVVRAGMTCKDLHGAIQDRHVWVDQLEKFRRKNPVLRSATPPLTRLSAQELKTFVTGWAKLRLRWDKDCGENSFAMKGLIGIPGMCGLGLLPGGKSMLVIDNRGGLVLRRVELEGSQVSMPVVANIKYDQGSVFGGTWSKLLTAVSPCPILVHRQGNNIHLVRIDHHNDAMSLETTFPIPEGFGFLRAHGQGRVVGFLIQKPLEPPRAVVIHLDYPGVIMESEVSPTYITGATAASYLWNICIPTGSLVVVYNTQYILACKIPNFSTLSRGVHLSSATPMWSWPGLDQIDSHIWIQVSYMTSEALYDPPSAQAFNIHYICRRIVLQAITVTIPTNTDDDFAPESTEPPALKQKSTPVQGHIRGQRSGGFSCRKGLHSDLAVQGDKINILVTPLDDLVLEDGRGALRMTVPFKEFRHCSQTIEMDMDEATGRVVIWGWDKDAYETRIFVGDLV